MNATKRDPQDLLHAAQGPQGLNGEDVEDRPISLWFWIVPTVLMLAYVAWFAHLPPVKVIPATPIESLGLPQLGAVSFDAGKPTLTEDGQATLDRAAQAMHGNPNVRLRFDGYDTPQPPRVKQHDHSLDPLTRARARAVETYLDARGVERTRISGGHPLHPPAPSTIPEPGADSSPVELYVQ